MVVAATIVDMVYKVAATVLAVEYMAYQVAASVSPTECFAIE